jgi:hypothetical protein
MIIEILQEFIINGDTLYVHQELKLVNSSGIHDGKLCSSGTKISEFFWNSRWKIEFSKFFGN